MKHLGCKYLFNSIYFSYDSLWHCCFILNEHVSEFFVLKDYNGGKINWEKIFEIKKQLREDLKKGNVPPNCHNCVNLIEQEWDERNKIDEIFVSHHTTCNSKCYYCYIEKEKERFSKLKGYDLYNTFKDMYKKGIIDDSIVLHLGGGEPTIFSQFEKIMKLFLSQGSGNILVPTSGIKHSPTLEKALKLGKAITIVSIDSADKETYKKIKQVDAFDKVVANLKKYTKANPERVLVKYIICPGINDSREHIEKWYNLLLEIGVKKAAVDIEVWYMRECRDEVSSVVGPLIDYFEEKAHELGMDCELYCYAQQFRHEESQKQ